MSSSKVLERALDEIERLKLEIKGMQSKEPLEKPTWAPKKRDLSRLDKIFQERDAAMERFSKKLFGGNNAKQKQK